MSKIVAVEQIVNLEGNTVVLTATHITQRERTGNRERERGRELNPKTDPLTPDLELDPRGICR